MGDQAAAEYEICAQLFSEDILHLCSALQCCAGDFSPPQPCAVLSSGLSLSFFEETLRDARPEVVASWQFNSAP